MWSVTTGGEVQDMTYDTRHGTVWAVIGDHSTRHLCEYNMEGECVREVGKGMMGYGVCVDTRRDCLVVSHYIRLLCMDREGGKVREIRVPGARLLCGVVYCEERDVSVVGDVGVHCLWYIDAGSGAVVRQVGSEGSGEGQLRYPWYLCHHHVSEGECHIYVSDCDNHCISMYTASGDYIRRFGSQGSGDRQLSNPQGVCVDGIGRVVVCDQGNERVVRYWWERDVEQWDVILTPQQLESRRVVSVVIPTDSQMIIGVDTGILYFPFDSTHDEGNPTHHLGFHALQKPASSSSKPTDKAHLTCVGEEGIMTSKGKPETNPQYPTDAMTYMTESKATENVGTSELSSVAEGTSKVIKAKKSSKTCLLQ